LPVNLKTIYNSDFRASNDAYINIGKNVE
jgi:hypothetical protein